MRCASWNIWFDSTTMHHRLPLIVMELQKHQHDVLAMQEVTPPMLRYLLESDWALQYRCSHGGSSSLTLGRYGTVMFVRSSLESSFSVEFSERPFENSGMGRTLLWATMSPKPGSAVATRPLRVFTSHLESLPAYKKARQQQLAVVHDLVTTHFPPVATVFMGDTNFCHPTEDFGADGWHDSWVRTAEERAPQPVDLEGRVKGDQVAYSRHAGLTFDGVLNKNADAFRSRLDRIFYFDPADVGTVSAANFRLWGVDEYETTGTASAQRQRKANETGKTGKGRLSLDVESVPRRMHPSDHFGVAVDITW